MNRQVSEEDIETANKHVKCCWTSLVTREMQTQTTVRHHKTMVKNRCWRGRAEIGTLRRCWRGSVLQPLWKTVLQNVKQNTKTLCDPATHPSTYPREPKTYIDRESVTGMCTAAVLIKAKKRKRPKCPSADGQAASGDMCTRRRQPAINKGSDTHYNTEEPWKRAAWKKPDTNTACCVIPLCETLGRGKLRKQTRGLLGWDEGVGSRQGGWLLVSTGLLIFGGIEKF